MCSFNTTGGLTTHSIILEYSNECWSKKGIYYNGTMSVSKSGVPCLNWRQQWTENKRVFYYTKILKKYFCCNSYTKRGKIKKKLKKSLKNIFWCYPLFHSKMTISASWVVCRRRYDYFIFSSFHSKITISGGWVVCRQSFNRDTYHRLK